MAKKRGRFVLPKFVFPVFIILLILSLFGNGYGFYRIWQGNRVTAVPDGDSIDLADGRRVRLLALDAPERGRCVSEEAKAGLTALVLGRHVRLKNTVKDSFGRTLAIVIIDEPRAWFEYLRWWFFNRLLVIPAFTLSQAEGQAGIQPFMFLNSQFSLPRRPASPRGEQAGILNSLSHPDPDPLVNRVMVSRGWARLESAPEPYADSLKSASQTAKDGKLGIWSDLCRSLSSGTSCTVKGNVRDGKKTYHYPGCDNYDQVIVDLSYGDAWFCTQKEAMALGFSKASGCR